VLAKYDPSRLDLLRKSQNLRDRFPYTEVEGCFVEILTEKSEPPEELSVGRRTFGDVQNAKGGWSDLAEYLRYGQRGPCSF
jgi:hypothetical protein